MSLRRPSGESVQTVPPKRRKPLGLGAVQRHHHTLAAGMCLTHAHPFPHTHIHTHTHPPNARSRSRNIRSRPEEVERSEATRARSTQT